MHPKITAIFGSVILGFTQNQFNGCALLKLIQLLENVLVQRKKSHR